MQMELSDILILVKAGYTRDEIEHMAQPEHTQPQPVSVQQPATEPEPAAEQQPIPAPADEPSAATVPAAQPVPQPQDVPAQPTMDDLMKSMAKLTSAIQANAIANSFMPGGSPREPDAAEVLGQIIRPTRTKKGV